MKYLNDSAIVRLFLERSEEAPHELEKKYGAACFSVAKGILGSREDAEECVNDALMKVWEAVPPAQPKLLGAYVLRITRNLAINRAEYNSAAKRSSFSLCLEELSECVPSAESVEKSVELKELSAIITEYVNSLKDEERYLFIRRYWYFDTFSDIADKLGVREDAVRARLSRSRKKLRAYLLRYEEGTEHELQ